MTSYNNTQAIKYMEVIVLLLSPVSVWWQNGLEAWAIGSQNKNLVLQEADQLAILLTKRINK